jgi:reactive intermediate/imine deaminase
VSASSISRVRLSDHLPDPLSHYTDAVWAGDTLYISGMLAFNPKGELVGAGDSVAQTDQILRNVGVVLDHAGLSFADVVKVVVYLLDINDRVPINAARQRHFGSALPASTLVEVSALADPAARVEIDVIAYAGRRSDALGES